MDIDLRWGVTEEQAKSGKVIDICLQEVDGSRPFFICMLGNRYGWIPDKKDIPKETISHYKKLENKNMSITHMEIHHAVFEPLDSDKMTEEIPHSFFYFRDENTIPDPATIDELTNEEKNEFKNAFFEENENIKNQIKQSKFIIFVSYLYLIKLKTSQFQLIKRFKTYPERIYI